MKFIAQNSNLMIVLRPGIPGSHLSGKEPVPGMYVKFQDGMVIVNDEEQIRMMLKHPGFNTDFISAEEVTRDPFSYRRSEMEPGHIIQQVKYGHVEGVQSSAKKVPLTPEMNKIIEDLANAKIKELLPGILENTLKELAKVSREKAESAEKEAKSEEVVDNKEEIEEVLNNIPESEAPKRRGRPSTKTTVSAM